MNEDFGINKNPRQPTPNGTMPQPSINPNNYRPIARVLPQPVTNGRPEGMDLPLNNADKKDKMDHMLPPGKKSWFRRCKEKIQTFLSNLTKKQLALLIVAILIAVGGIAAGVAMLLKNDQPVATTPSIAEPEPEPAPAPKPTSPLTGLEVAQEDTTRPVIGVMIENSTAARPQSGLREAGIVYEAIAEYGITRFLALYQEAAPGNIGPVRSARPYYVDWAHAYDAAYAHVGGSPDALAKIKADGVRDIDQFANGNFYRRVSEREAPHNVYTTMAQLRELTASKGWTSSTFTGLPRKAEAPATAVTAQRIDIKISGPTYNVHYDYDAASNSYLRVMGGAAHTDAESGAQLAPKVVIALATSYGLLADGYHSTYGTTGTGSAKVFQDGAVIDATWTRDGNGQYQFTNPEGHAVAFNPGQTWITAIGSIADATFTPPPAATPAP